MNYNFGNRQLLQIMCISEKDLSTFHCLQKLVKHNEINFNVVHDDFIYFLIAL
jgi:hypothetical protein